jgi:hypothetical protein
VEIELLFSFKIIFFRRRFRRMHEAPRGATRAQNCLMKRQGGGRRCPRGCAVVPANLAGLFRLLPSIGKGENRRNQSQGRGKPEAGPSAHGDAYGTIRRKVQPELLCDAKKRVAPK